MSPQLDNLTYLLQLLAGGVSAGALYALLGLAIVVVYKTTTQLNLAQGEMGALGAFLTFSLTAAGLNVWVGILIAMAVTFLLGCGIERGLIRPLERKGHMPPLLVTLGLFLVINAGIALVWGTQPVQRLSPFPSGLQDKVDILSGSPPFYLTYGTLGIIAVLGVLLVSLWLGLTKTRLGLAYRAMASNRDAAALMGIPVGKMFVFGWGVAAAIGTLAAALVSQSLGTLDYNLMATILIFGIAAATLGGFDSLLGAAVGGLILGVVEAMVPGVFTVINGDLSLVVALAVILVVLLARPQGLFGTKRIERV